MAVRFTIWESKPLIVKESGGKRYISSAVPWTDAPEKMPARVRERVEAFKEAVPKCVTEDKYKGGSVFGVSKYNRCIGNLLRKRKEVVA